MPGVVFIIGLFILLGIILSMGKGSFLIAGFNTMSKEEKEEYDVVSLCKFMGKVMFIIAFCITLFLLSEIFKIRVLFYIGLILFFIVIIFTLIYSNTGNRFKK
ncbi:DUF3784 domain-containing protein [Clostridium botulinum]|uniref:DUF3784 domain-containing protein n=1 Tax=Clostridium botulinum TaxID=1491 RepID=A0ABC8CYK8_CLOBO|nr:MULTISPECIES: DUF3784 domain-containing protein [Clostridium]APF28456.1 hypothetical protein NPD7_2515 [Clostridium sporogenes]AVQ39789.1 DUF3784 domain-containing protein [Clostridium botulinum]MDI6918334.1 DUF3784 domain-containing protein [Clostridium botulinum]MDU1320804.1 DUF3784 domain-containing protein [Clostridium botulinum]WMU98270.1 DUF3784 domain-containing protein [Clostridium botulinum]